MARSPSAGAQERNAGESFRLLRRLVLWAGIGVTAVFLIFAARETVELVRLAEAASPTLGQVTIWGFVLLYVALIGVPVVIFFRFPRSLRLPPADDPQAVAAYRRKLAERLAKNPRIRAAEVDVRADGGLEAALARLDEEANRLIRSTALGVLTATAISQSSRVDALIVLGAQARMIWHIAHIYAQRPGLAELGRLYVNAAVAAFVAVELEDADLEEQFEPLVHELAAASARHIPGMKLVAASLSQGIVNAFVILRVGVIARRYCGALAKPDPRQLRRSATREAAGMIGSLTKQFTASLTRALLHKAGQGVKQASRGTVRAAKSGIQKTTSTLRDLSRRPKRGQVSQEGMAPEE